MNCLPRQNGIIIVLFVIRIKQFSFVKSLCLLFFAFKYNGEFKITFFALASFPDVRRLTLHRLNFYLAVTTSGVLVSARAIIGNSPSRQRRFAVNCTYQKPY